MVRTKRNRIFLGIVTTCLALAGTGLTIANNWQNNARAIAIAITLAACFSGAESTFLWAHKVFEEVKKLWRKIVLVTGMVALVGAMSYAVYEELNSALSGVTASKATQDVSGVLNTSLSSITSKGNRAAKERENLASKAMSTVSGFHIKPETTPFVICYAITGLVSIIILGVGGEPKPRTKGTGNVIDAIPNLKLTAANKIGFKPADNTVRAYVDRNGKGYSIWSGSKHLGYVSEKDIT